METGTRKGEPNFLHPENVVIRERGEGYSYLLFFSPHFSLLPVPSIDQTQLGARCHGAWEMQSAGVGALQNRTGQEKLGEGESEGILSQDYHEGGKIRSNIK